MQHSKEVAYLKSKQQRHGPRCHLFSPQSEAGKWVKITNILTVRRTYAFLAEARIWGLYLQNNSLESSNMSTV